MKINKLILNNFRIYKDETIIDFNDITAFIGKNDIGKSTILEALDIFFNEKDAQVKLDKDDLSKNTDSNTLLIGIVFDELPENLVIDSTVETYLKDECLLNKDGLLEIHKTYSDGKLKSTHIIANHPTNEYLEDLLQLKITALKSRAQELSIDLTDVDSRKSSIIRKSIRGHFGNDIELNEKKILVDEEGSKQIWEQLKKYMPIYALFQSDRQNVDQDSEVQDPMKFAIKKILLDEGIKSKFKEIQDQVETTITEIANLTIEKLNEMNPELANVLKPKIPEPNWSTVFKGITISSEDDIPLNKRGSGVRRLILLNFSEQKLKRKKRTKQPQI